MTPITELIVKEFIVISYTYRAKREREREKHDIIKNSYSPVVRQNPGYFFFFLNAYLEIGDETVTYPNEFTKN